MRVGPRSGLRAGMLMIAPFLAGLEEMGIDAVALAGRVGLDPASLRDPDVRVPYESLVDFVTAAVDVTGDPALGLHLSERHRPGSFGVLDYLALSSATLGDALGQLCRYSRLLADAAETLVEDQGDRVFVWQRMRLGIRRPPAMVENVVANLILIARRLTGEDLLPIEVRFVHSEPAYASEHQRILRAPVRFSADRDGVLLHADVLRMRLATADPDLLAILHRHANDLLAQAPSLVSLSEQVRDIVLRKLAAGAPTAAQVAALLNVSKRTLSRRLREEDASYEAILDALRRDLSRRHLRDAGVTIEEVALMLGYAEMRAFRRAFQRWHGMSPAVFRRQGPSPDSPPP